MFNCWYIHWGLNWPTALKGRANAQISRKHSSMWASHLRLNYPVESQLELFNKFYATHRTQTFSFSDTHVSWRVRQERLSNLCIVCNLWDCVDSQTKSTGRTNWQRFFLIRTMCCIARSDKLMEVLLSLGHRQSFVQCQLSGQVGYCVEILSRYL